jgi:hypothetical protein
MIGAAPEAAIVVAGVRGTAAEAIAVAGTSEEETVVVGTLEAGIVGAGIPEEGTAVPGELSNAYKIRLIW